MKPKAYLFLGKTEVMDFRPMIKEVMDKHKDTCKWWIQFQTEPNLIMEGAIGITEFAADIKKVFLIQGIILGKVKKAQKLVDDLSPEFYWSIVYHLRICESSGSSGHGLQNGSIFY